MNIASLLQTLQSWPISAAIRGESDSTEWLFPIIETCHVFALAIVFGSIAMVDLRLLGIGARSTRVTGLTHDLLPWTWVAWCSAAAFGTLMFISKAQSYAGNLQFQMKFACMILAAINMLIFHFGAYRNVKQWDSGETPTSAKLAGALSISLWVGVLFFGRWTGFTT